MKRGGLGRGLDVLLPQSGELLETVVRDIAIDEIFGNIASYAYAPGTGKVTVQIRVDDKARAVRITFIDSGVPYNPLAKEDPNVKLSAEERKIGGLGIFLVKKSMDDMIYEYKDGKNRLTLVKKF